MVATTEDPAPSDPDLPLVLALQAGEERALDELMRRHQEAIFRFLYRFTRHEADAADLAQETFVRVFFKIGQFRPAGVRFSVWLYRIALNLCRDHARSRVVRQSRLTDSFSAGAPDRSGVAAREPASSRRDPGGELEHREAMEALQWAIDELPGDLKVAFILAALEGRPQEECAEILNTTRKTVETRVYRARKLLAEKLRVRLTHPGF